MKHTTLIGKIHDNCTTEFFHPWKPNHSAQHIAALLKANWTGPSSPVLEGGEAKEDKEVLKELTKYYKALFDMKLTDPAAEHECLQTLEDPTSRRVLPPTAVKCDAPIELQAIKLLMNSLPTGKRPGPDRLPNKMYKVLSDVLSEILTKVLNESQEEGADPRNYLPINLLPTQWRLQSLHTDLNETNE